MTTFAQPTTGRGNAPYVGGDKRYKLIDPGTGHPVTWSRVTTFTKAISDMFHLHQWDLRNAVKGMALRPDLVALAAATPLEEKGTLQQIANTAMEVAGNKVAANEGSAMHAFADPYDRGQSPAIPDGWREDIEEYAVSMAARSIKVIPSMVERYVAIPELRLCGKFDRVFEWDGRMVIGDMKTSKNIGYGWNEIAIQLAVYSRATHYWDDEADQWVPMPAVSREVAIVANTLVGRQRTDWYALPLTQGHKGIDLALAVRQWRSEKIPGVAIAPVAAYADRLRAARDMPELIGVFSEAQSAGAWNAELDAVALEMQAKFS